VGRWAVGSVLGAALLAAPALAHAATCVVVDQDRDGLSAEEQSSARTLFEDTLRHNQIAIARDDCTETWTLYHVRLGQNVTVVVRSPRGERRETVRKIEDLPGVYDQMTKSLVTGVVATNDSSVVDRKNVTESQTKNRRVAADAFWYARLGYGATASDGLIGGPAFGFGRRWELDRIGIDLSFLNLAIYQDEDGARGAGGSIVKLGVDYFLDPQANHTPCFGAGLSWGVNTIREKDGEGDYSGTGLQGELMAGYEMFRASSVRLFVEADASLPMYRTSRVEFDVTGGEERSYRYAPMFSLSLGLGWGKAAR